MATIRLVHIEADEKLSLTKHPFDQAPPYAILSHTWGADDEEVTFEDMRDDSWKKKVAHVKLRFCADQAMKDGLSHFWIDTCCINKADQRELQEAITSMYRWYKESEECYVLLSDVSSRKRNAANLDGTQGPDFHNAKWFTRGWTLQELLAPRCVKFYSRDGTYLGDKRSLEREIHAITNIDKRALGPTPLSAFGVRQRMSWARNRKTKLVEDKSYSLAGLFGVSILPNYGEGESAFRRLKREIAEAFRTEVDEITDPWSAPLARSPGDTSAELSPDAKREKHRDSFMSALYFSQMGTRQCTIQHADNFTCDWFLTHPAYAEWLEPGSPQDDRRFLWLFGKPGAGKSTLMKFAHANAQKKKPEDEIIISFFFNARGNQLERSVTGMFRALLFQLVTEAGDLRAIFDELEIEPLTVAMLQKLFLTAMRRMGHRYLRCFIDALDECPEHQVQEMISFLEDVGINAANANAKLYVCFASRHYPTIYTQYGEKMTLENQRGHAEDIARYVQSHLRAGKGVAAQEIRTELHKKANGVFLWVVLVTAILNNEYRRGNIFRVKTKLRELPPELGALFKEIICKDEVDKQHLLLALQWILFAARPLTREEYYIAMVTSLEDEPTVVVPWDLESIDSDDMARFVHSSSKGLAELTESEQPTVQFIHESVRDYLIKQNGMSQMWPDLGPDLRFLSHDRLKWCCYKYFCNLGRQAFLSSKNADDKTEVTRHSPFLEYATRFVLHHAEEALSSMAPQVNFFQSFGMKTWIHLQNIFTVYEDQCLTTNASLLYIFADNDCPGLIGAMPPTMPTLGDREQTHGYPIFAAFDKGYRDAVRALLFQIESRANGEESEPSRTDDTQGPMNLDEVNDVGQTALHCAVSLGWVDVMQLLLDKGASTNGTDDEGNTVLHVASKFGLQEAVQLLLNSGAYIEATDGDGLTALAEACQSGAVKTVQLLIDNGASLETMDRFCMTALHYAAREGRGDIVRLLIEEGAHIEATNSAGYTALHLAALRDYLEQVLKDSGASLGATDDRGWTALHYAVRYQKACLVRSLVGLGAQIEAVDNDGSTALHIAANMGSMKMVRLLLSNGANLEATNDSDMTPLHCAAHWTRKGVVQLLIEKGANINAIDEDGCTPLDWASVALDGKPDSGGIIELLKAKGAIAGSLPDIDD